MLHLNGTDTTVDHARLLLTPDDGMGMDLPTLRHAVSCLTPARLQLLNRMPGCWVTQGDSIISKLTLRPDANVGGWSGCPDVGSHGSWLA